MPSFRYVAKNMDGEMTSGIYDNPDKNQLVKMLRQKGFFPLTIEKIEQSKDLKDIEFSSKMTIKDLAVFCRQFASLLSAGLALLQIMVLLGEQNENKKLRRSLQDITDNVRRGMPLSDAMNKQKAFPPLLINMVAAGELGGNLDRVFDTMSTFYEKEYKTTQKIKTAMTYPIILVTVTIGVVYFLLTTVVPTFLEMFSGMGVALPLPTRILLAMSAFLTEYGIIVLLGMVLFVVLFKIAVSQGKGRLLWHKLLLKTPLFGKMISLVMSSRFSRTMSTLLKSGTPLLSAIEMTKKIMDNACAEVGLTNVQERVRLGGGLWGPLDQSKLFPSMVIHMVRVGEESGSLDEMLANTARFYEEETDNYVVKLTTLMEPAMILILGGVVAFVVISIVMPMFGMMGMMGA